jgi:hypothetical protein
MSSLPNKFSLLHKSTPKDNFRKLKKYASSDRMYTLKCKQDLFNFFSEVIHIKPNNAQLYANTFISNKISNINQLKILTKKNPYNLLHSPFNIYIDDLNILLIKFDIPIINTIYKRRSISMIKEFPSPKNIKKILKCLNLKK